MVIEKQIKEQIKELQAKLSVLESKVNIFSQKGVLYWVWDDDDDEYKHVRGLHSFDEDTGMFRQLTVAEVDNTWEHHKLLVPQWLDIPDDFMKAPSIEGTFVIECKNGYIKVMTDTEYCTWDAPADAGERIKRICILEEQV